MKSLIATAALSLLALSTIAEAQPQKNQSKVEAQLMASLPVQDATFSASAPKSLVSIQSLMASLPAFDANTEAPVTRVSTAQLMASLPTVDEDAQDPDVRVKAAKLLASLPTMDENAEVPASGVNVSKLMASLPAFDATAEMPVVYVNVAKMLASLPAMDEFTATSVLVDTDIHHLDVKNHQTATRLTEE